MNRRRLTRRKSVALRALLPALVALLEYGCTTPVPRALPPTMLPPSFENSAMASSPSSTDSNWWEAFGDPDLTALIARAEGDNQDLEVAAARVMQAEAQVAIQRSVLLPQLGAQATRTEGGCNGQSCLDYTGARSAGVSLTASYELDIWGLARDNLRATKELVKAARFARQSLALSVAANLAQQYFDVLATRRRIAIANDYIGAVSGLIDNIKLRVKAGAASHLDLAREQAQLESVNALLPGLETEERQALFTLALLLGQPPEGFLVRAQSLDDIQAPEVAPGVPSQLLLRRPDIAAAEASLASAHANVDAARAAFLPQISLTGSGGFVNSAIFALLHSANFGYGYGATLLQTIFDGGRLSGQRHLAQGVQREYIAAYQSAALHAFGDVELALVQVANTRRAEQHLRLGEEAARDAFKISELQYRQGTTDLLAVLQAQQTLYLAQDQRVQNDLDNRRAIVNLYKALGGGWTEDTADRTQTPRVGD